MRAAWAFAGAVLVFSAGVYSSIPLYRCCAPSTCVRGCTEEYEPGHSWSWRIIAADPPVTIRGCQNSEGPRDVCDEAGSQVCGRIVTFTDAGCDSADIDTVSDYSDTVCDDSDTQCSGNTA